MFHYTLVYDRPSGEILYLERFDDSHAALEERHERERVRTSDQEVVVLGAESFSQLIRTHSRYFFTVQELAERAYSTIGRNRGVNWGYEES